MTVLFTIALATLHFENNHLLALHERVHYLTHYFCTVYGGCAYRYCAVSIYEQHFLKFNSITSLNILDAVDIELLSLLYFELLTVNFYNCVH